MGHLVSWPIFHVYFLLCCHSTRCYWQPIYYTGATKGGNAILKTKKVLPLQSTNLATHTAAQRVIRRSSHSALHPRLSRPNFRPHRICVFASSDADIEPSRHLSAYIARLRCRVDQSNCKPRLLYSVFLQMPEHLDISPTS